MGRIPVVLSDEKKERWSQFVEENPEYDSVSDLVRTSVERQIAADGSSGNIDEEQIDKVISEIDVLDSKISNVDTEMKALRAENVTKSALSS